MEYKSVSTKMPRDEVTLLRAYCERKGTTPSSLIRELILREINVPIPHSIAGKNIIKYDKEKDSFTWSVKLDNGDESEVLVNISPAFIEDLQKMMVNSLNERDTFLGKSIENSVPIPSKILRGKKW